MKFLLIGNGGREHTLAWKLQQSSLCEKLYIAPGNAGTALCGENLPVDVSDFEGIKDLCLKKEIDMVIPGPEVPLVEGIADYFQQTPELKHISVIGPGKTGARLEGSKAFAKSFMQQYNIPTADCKEFSLDQLEEGKQYLRNQHLPIVLKADGLAAGKGVIICTTHNQAVNEFEQMLKGKFGKAGDQVVVEEFLSGIELSVFLLTDGEGYVILPEAKDYKRIGEGDTGLNTGGMGAVSPVPFVNDAFMQKIEKRIIEPTIKGIREKGLNYKGFIFLGLIKVGADPYVIEYNCRMGDPETQVIVPRIKNDLGVLFKAVAEGTIAEQKIETSTEVAATTIVVSGGYPGPYQKGKEISLPETIAGQHIFYAGAIKKEDKLVTNGGRVVAATACAKTLNQALKQSKILAKNIHFENRYFRKDIGWEFLS